MAHVLSEHPADFEARIGVGTIFACHEGRRIVARGVVTHV